MAYAFEHLEPVPSGVRRIMDEQIVRARTNLTDESATIDKRVHDARKRFKETRALLRLVREPLGEQFAIENAWFRDAARELAAARDADAVIEALEKLELPRGLATRVKNKLRAAHAEHPPLPPIIANVLDQLVVAQARIALWPAMPDSFETIAGGLLRTYRGGRRAMRSASTPDELHEWRKRVKEHWYHLQLLRDVWPAIMKPYAAELQTLSRLLGDHHDLHVLGELVTAPSVVAAIGARQLELEHAARDLARRVYAEPSRAWLARMRNYWRAWQR